MHKLYIDIRYTMVIHAYVRDTMFECSLKSHEMCALAKGGGDEL